MISFRRILIMIVLPTFLLTSCNLPASLKVEGPSAEDLALTIVAQTMEAEAARATEPPSLPTNPPVPQKTTVSVSTATNCRTGPDINYTLVLTFQPGASAEVIGKYSPANYWIITTPTGGTCWLWGAYATVQGDTSILPEMAAPPPPVAAVEPTAVPSGGDGGSSGTGDGGITLLEPLTLNPSLIHLLAIPVQPASFSATANCDYISFMGIDTLVDKTDHLTWSSVSNATGYKIYVNGIPVEDLSGTSTSINAMTYSSSNYGVAAYNATGTSSVKTIPAPDCP